MKTKLSVLTAVVILFTACSPTLDTILTEVEKVTAVQLNSLSSKMKEGMEAWDIEIAKNKTPDRNTDGTWLDVGVRYKYFVLKDYVNVQLIKELAGVPIYTKGPHQTAVNFNATEFGHYNPEFLTKVQNTLDDATQIEAFNTIAQVFYDKELKQMTRTFYRAYKHIQTNGDKYSVKYDQEEFRSYADSEEKAGYDWYESVTAPGFWVRRKADGTDTQFVQLLKTVLAKYDAEFVL